MERSEYSSAQKFVDNLLNEGVKVRCDKTSKDFNNHNKLPPFYDEDLYRRGQEFFHKHMFAFFFSKCLGLLSVLSIPSILNILIHTKMSSNSMTAYKRYMATIFHMMVWYDLDFKPGSRAWKSITQVKGMHNSASIASCSAGLGGINQKDMVLTQFGFMGISLTRSKLIGIHHTSEEEWKAFLHVWRVVGYLMGIEDRFNLCSGTVEETREICNLLMEQVFRRNIEKKNEDFLSMSNYLLNGLWCMTPTINYESMMCYLYFVVQDNINNNNNRKIDPTYLKLNSVQNFHFYFLVYSVFLLRYNWFRIYQNYVEVISLWLMKVFPFLAYYQFGVANSYVKIMVNDKITNT